MSLPVNDNLTAGSVQLITTYSANWSETISGNVVNVGTIGAYGGTAAAHCAAHWNADAFPNDQYCQATISNLSGTAADFLGVVVRASTASSGLGYIFRVDGTGTHYRVSLYSGGTTDLIASTARTFLAGDVLKVTVIGTTITAYQNGISFASTTDSAFSGGAAGVYFFGSSSARQLITWSAGSLASATDTLLGQGWV